MAVHRTRVAWSALVAVVLVVGGVVAPATADDPPVVWDAAPGYPDMVDDVTVGFETTMRDSNPWGISSPPAPPVPYIRPVVVNGSAVPRYFGFGMDIAEQGTVEQLWMPEPWGLIYDLAPGINDAFVFELAPGQSYADAFVDISLNDGVPQWAGRTFVIYELSGPEASDPTAVQIATFTASGRFAPGHLDEMTVQDLPAVGQPLEITGTGAASLVFPGVVATVEASGLVAGEELELWLIPNYDYFFLMLLGGSLPTEAVPVGGGTVADGGTLSTWMIVPADTPLGADYLLVAGVPGERYWPAGTHRNFPITEPVSEQSEPTPTDGSPVSMTFDDTAVTFTYPIGTGAGTTTAVVTETGPAPDAFELSSSPPLYYHLDTTSTWPEGELVEVCITYDAIAMPGAPPFLYHFEESAGQWVNITTSREVGTVCGLTSGFSAFTLGTPLHDGSTVAPAKGVLSSDNGWDTGLRDGDYTITMDLWWGENAGSVRLLENGALIAEQWLTRNSPNAQRTAFPISGKANGTYVYTAELVNSTGVTTTKALTVKVTDANPGKPVVSATSPKNGGFTLTANMSWGTNATSAQFYQGGVPVGDPIALTPNTPHAQSASLSLVRAKGDYVYRVAFTNAAGTTWSADLKVRVK
ncbi:MAG: hypothetical protein ABWZ42_04515 [Ilumatobacteraceae bacterium]